MGALDHTAPHEAQPPSFPAPKPALSLSETALLVGLSHWQFRKVWEAYVADRDFPAPFRQPPSSNYAWARDEVEAWVHRVRDRKPRLPQSNIAALPSRPRDFAATATATQPALQRQRNELAAMMKRGA